ncbi:hypothetical protein HCK00_05195 [Streptomyces sp. PLAI1-29]|uniref:Uncharacterized protein n=1 Tax=Streptomyces zingiberis TaxID=2053010 RepID=A0ABX1BXB3_9ACTN|nr:hypothetical protein [Streptomyces zingiberis]
MLSRLGVTDQAPYPLCTPDEALQRFEWDKGIPAARVCYGGEWTFLLDVCAHGRLLQPSVLTRLSLGTEAVSVWHPLTGSTRIAHACDGALMASFDTWAVHLTDGQDVSRLNRALADAGFFPEDDEDYPDDWTDSAAALVVLEREFGLELSPQVAKGALPAVSLQHLQG